MRLLYGTTNEGKLAVMRRALAPLTEIEIIGLKDLGMTGNRQRPQEPGRAKQQCGSACLHQAKQQCGSACVYRAKQQLGSARTRRAGESAVSPAVLLPQIEETGATPLENARIKALAYYQALQIPVFSCDTGLYFDGLPQELQPGIHVRTIRGRRLSDGEMTAYYAGLARKYGGLTARYKNAVCLVLDDTHIYESMDDSLSGEPFLLTDTPHPRRQEGFPIDCLSKHIGTGEYYYDMEGERQDDLALDAGFYHFFKSALGLS